ncbi:hypothetical protein [Dyella sp.]|uniref:hypothetical protein n=1 Tax=Dyella sp. TaxID=1869338 RepID=UPI003F7FF030
MDVSTTTAAIRALLTDDATFAADIEAAIGQPVARVLRANTPWEQIGASQLPCWVMEQGDGETSSWAGGDETGLVIGHRSQAFAYELDICLLWNEQSRENAADQRAALPGALARLFLRNPQPGGCNAAWLKAWMPDQGVRHPLQCWVARVHCEITLED